VFSEDGRNLGVLAAQLNWRWAEHVRQETLRQFAGRDVPDLLVVSSDGLVLLGPEHQLGRRIEGVAAPSAAGWAEDATGIVTGQARIHGAPQYPGAGWMVMAQGDSAAILLRSGRSPGGWPWGRSASRSWAGCWRPASPPSSAARWGRLDGTAQGPTPPAGSRTWPRR
jgi:hypothetical protein